MSSSTTIGIPTDEKVFESNCVPLFAGVINDPTVKLLGTRGKKQFGLDLIGRRDRDPAQPVGIQCKLITRGAKLSEKIVRDEVKQALAITPPLTEFYVVTTATDEPALDLLAIELSQEQVKAGRRIDIQVWGWDTLQDKIRSDPRALAAFDPDYSASTNKLIALGTEAVQGQSHLFAQNERLLQGMDAISALIAVGPVDTARSAFEQHLDIQVDQYRDLMNTGKPRTALSLLELLDGTLGDASSPAIRARVKANIAYARLRLGDESSGAGLLAEAYALNPTDPKVRANYILALALQGDLEEAWHFAEQVLRDDPMNLGAAGLTFQVASMSNETRDPLAIVPVELLEDLNVSIHRISYLRAKGTPDSWWQLASDTLERFPEDGTAMRMAGDALIDEALSERSLERRSLLADGRRSKLLAGAALLQRHWDIVRLYENATDPNWLMVSYNLITAYRALGDLDQAKAIADQMLALGSTDPDSFLSAAWVAIDRDAFAEAVNLLRRGPTTNAATLPLIVALSNKNDWAEVLNVATAERREALVPSDRQLFDTLLFRARRVADPAFDLGREVDRLLKAWPLGISAHIAVADIYRRDKPEEVAAVAAKAKSLITEEASFSDRVMFAQLSLFRDAWDDLIAVLDGHVRVDRPSEELGWLALAFANSGTKPRTAPFFKSLGPDVITLPRFSRLAGAAEHNRGDLKTAERYLRATITADLDTLTLWQLRELGHLAAAKDYLGRLCIPRSSFDEILEVRAKIESNRGREFMTMGYDGDQAWRHVHTLEETEAQLAMVNGVIADVEAHCEILPVDGSEDTRLEQLIGGYVARKIFDPAHLAKSQGLIIVSEDLNLRQFAAQQKVIGGAWLQIVLDVLGAEGVVTEADYLIAVGRLGAMRHDHVWVDAKILIGILTLDDPRAFALYEAAIRFMGGRKAEMRSHLAVTLGLMRAIWVAELPGWEQGRAVGKLLEQLTRSRPDDWKAVLHLIDAELGKLAARGDRFARRGQDYLADWITGHFYDLEEIRSFEKIVTELRTARPLKAAKNRKARRARAG